MTARQGVTEKKGIFMPMTYAFKHMLETATPGTRKKIEDDLVEFMDEIGSFFEGTSRLQAVCSGVDSINSEYIKRHPRGKEISCGNACSGCCHIMVKCSDEEALYAYTNNPETVASNKDRLEKQAACKNEDEYIRMEPKDSACVFLTKAKNCSIYKARPLSCRNYYVVSPSADCGKAGVDVGQFFVEGSEILSTAYATVRYREIGDASFKSLPEHLLRILKEKEDGSRS